ncbi:hypothetical protein [Clostridium sp. DL1XJH146]
MVHLKEIIYQNGIIKCLYSPEKCGEYGFIEYNVNNDSLVSLKQTKYDEDKQFYYMNVKNKLRAFVKDINNIPNEYNLVIF